MIEARKKIANLVSKLIKNDIDKQYLSHREFTSLTLGKASFEEVAKMSHLKKIFKNYVETEKDDNTGNSAKYRWKVEKFRRDHRDLFGDDTDLKLSKIEQMIVALKDELSAARSDVQRNSYKIEKIEAIRLGDNN